MSAGVLLAAGLAAALTGAAPTSLELADLARVDARTGALLIDGTGRGEIDGSATWALAPQDEGGGFAVTFVVEVAGHDLLRRTPEGAVPVAMAAYVLDDGGRLAAFLSRGAVLDDPARELATATGLRWVDRLELAPGRYSIRLMVRNYRTDAAFLDRLEVAVPTADAPRSVLPPPRLAPAPDGWLEARLPAPTAVPAAAAGDAPSARPVLVNGAPSVLGIVPPGDADLATLRARLVDPAGRVIAEPGLAVAAEPAAPAPYQVFRLEPFDVPAGRYRLVVTAPGEDDTAESASSVEVLVAADAQAPWPVAARDPGVPPPPTEAGGVGAGRLRTAYREALAELARGDEIAARRRLAELEREVAARGSGRALTRLVRTQRGEAETLLRAEPAALAPMLWLHRDMSRYYRARHESALAAHAWTMATNLAELAATVGGPEGRRYAADVLTELAGELVQVPAVQTATRLLRRALQLDPDHVDALIALGACLEQQSEAGDAAHAFARAVRLDPGRSEARLRHAVNLDRTGGDGAAETTYRELLDGGAPPWIRKIALEQLALLLVERGAAGEAAALVERGLAVHGHDPRLTIQLAFCLDAAGEPRRADEVLAGLHPAAGDERSARFRYGEWPRLGPRVEHRRLAETAAAGRPALAAVLGVATVGGER